jgi:protein-tyrosine phosphatase
MKAGLLFRSAELSGLSGEDLRELRRLNVRLICDLRTPRERRINRSRIPLDSGIRIVNVALHPHTGDFPRLRLFRFLFSHSGRAAFQKFIREYYRTFAFERTERIKEVMTLLADEENLPALIHCKAGRDRTGFIAALLQLLAGVPRAAVLEEYLLTNRYYEPNIDQSTRYVRWLSLFRVPAAQVREIMQARSDYLEEVLDELCRRYGSVEGYLRQACGLEHEQIENLRLMLLE